MLNALNAQRHRVPAHHNVRVRPARQQQPQQHPGREKHHHIRGPLNTLIGDEPRQPPLGVAALQKLAQATAGLTRINVHGRKHNRTHHTQVGHKQNNKSPPPQACITRRTRRIGNSRRIRVTIGEMFSAPEGDGAKSIPVSHRNTPANPRQTAPQYQPQAVARLVPPAYAHTPAPPK